MLFYIPLIVQSASAYYDIIIVLRIRVRWMGEIKRRVKTLLKLQHYLE